MDKEYAKCLLNKVREDYNLISGDFSRTRRYPWPEIKFLFDYAKKGDKVLDLGCGNGRFCQFLKGTDYTGADISSGLIKEAKKRHPKLEFIEADALNLPFSDNSFDVVLSIAVLHHIPSKELRIRFLKEARRVLKEKGKIIITVWKFHRKKDRFLLLKYTILKILGKTRLDFKDILEPWGKKTERYYHWFSKRELVKLAEEAGFKAKGSGFTKKKNRENIYLVAEK